MSPQAAAAGLDVQIALRRGALDLDVALTAGPGEVLAVVGPNGAGKSTLLRVLAGLLAPDHGRVRLDGVVLEDTDDDIRLAPQARDLGVVFQDHRLFEHLSVLANVAFGPRSRGAGRRQAEQQAVAWLERVGLAEMAAQRPAQLSGGQRQRVALARALVGSPACLLLDEPLSALDAETRSTVRRELRTHLAAMPGPVLLVTHEPLEALALADRLVVLEGGRVTQQGSAQEVARRPRSEWIARLVGLNLFTGRSAAAGGPADARVSLDGGGVLTVAGVVPDGDVWATVHPRAVSLHAEQPAGSPRNVWSGPVTDLEIAGDRIRVVVGSPTPIVAEVTAAALAELDIVEGVQLWASFKAADVGAYAR